MRLFIAAIMLLSPLCMGKDFQWGASAEHTWQSFSFYNQSTELASVLGASLFSEYYLRRSWYITNHITYQRASTEATTEFLSSIYRRYSLQVDAEYHYPFGRNNNRLIAGAGIDSGMQTAKGLYTVTAGGYLQEQFDDLEQLDASIALFAGLHHRVSFGIFRITSGIRIPLTNTSTQTFFRIDYAL